MASGRTIARLARGFFVEPTVFTGVTQKMRIAREEIFGPVLSILEWTDEEAMFEQVNAVEYGLTASIWTTNLANAHRAASRIEAGYIWINSVGAHFLGASFGGYKQSGIGREEGHEELLTVHPVEERQRHALAARARRRGWSHAGGSLHRRWLPCRCPSVARRRKAVSTRIGRSA